jgi:hypothetical protein
MRAKYVYESLSFERGQDPKSSMGVGLSSIWKEVKERNKWSRPGIEDVFEAGLRPSIIKKIEPQYYWSWIAIFPDVFAWVGRGAMKLSVDEIAELDRDVAESFEDREVLKNIGKISIILGNYIDRELRITSWPEFRDIFPEICKFIEQNPQFFVRISETDIGNTSANWYASAIMKFFDPLKYNPDELIGILNNMRSGSALSSLFKYYPDYIKFFNKKASIFTKKTVLFDWGVNREIDISIIVDSLWDQGYIPAYNHEAYDMGELGQLIRIAEGKTYRIYTESFPKLIARGLESNKINPSDLKKIKVKISRSFPSEIVLKYFDKVFPELTNTNQKMDERSKADIDRDYESAESFIKKFSWATISTSPTQRSNRTISFKTPNGSVFTINNSGYLRKKTPGADRMGVVIYDPFSTYEKLAAEAIKRAQKLIK